MISNKRTKTAESLLGTMRIRKRKSIFPTRIFRTAFAKLAHSYTSQVSKVKSKCA